jgi:hypothetical protein
MKKIIVLLAVTAMLSACYRDVEELLYPGSGTCDTSNVTYAGTVVPLLQNFGCISCHSGAAPAGNIPLDTYTRVNTVAQNGKLYGSINHMAGFSPMPQGMNKMNACDISRIKAWIDAGHLNN